MKLFKYILLSISSVAIVNAATIAWDNGGADVLWSTAANWGGDVLPGVADTAQNYTTADYTLQTTQSVNAYQARNNILSIITGGSLTVAGTSKLSQGGSANQQHRFDISGTGSLISNAINYSSAGSSDTLSEIIIADSASLTVNNGISQAGNHGTFRLTQSGTSTARIDGTLEIGSRASATTSKNYQLNVSGGALSYGVGNFGTEAATSANTLISLTGSTYTINASADGGSTITGDTNLGVDSQTTFTFDSSGIGTWNAGDLTIDAVAQFTVDLAAISGSLSYTDEFELFNYTLLTNAFDASQFSVINNTSGNGAYVYDNGAGSIFLAVAPEPSSMALLAIGLTSLAFTRRRRA